MTNTTPTVSSAEVDTWPCPICGGNDDDVQLMCEACGGAGMLGNPEPMSDTVASVEAGAAVRATQASRGVWHYRGWIITPDDFGGGWTAYSENYDADYQGEEDGFVDNGEKVSGASVSACCDEIDAWIAEAEEAERAEERANHDGPALSQPVGSEG